ncbi:MAG TPA: hypothetical protein VGR61_09690 [Candidatus Dormibacteraeota bacterium]|nr:hypothetical protein [Candidatus Dormibacteraeota bacterium]
MPERSIYTTCALYTPGHLVHWIQARIAREGDPTKREDGTLVSVADNGWITVDVAGEVRRFWTHDPVRARHNFEASGGQVGLPGVGLLHAPTAEGRFCIRVADEEQGVTPCASPSMAGSGRAGLVQQLMSHGGFSISGQEALLAKDSPGLPPGSPAGQTLN